MFGVPLWGLNVFCCIKDTLPQITPIYTMPVRFKLAVVYMLLKTALGDLYRALLPSSIRGSKLSFNSSVLLEVPGSSEKSKPFEECTQVTRLPWQFLTRGENPSA